MTKYVRADATGAGDGTADTAIGAWTLAQFQATTSANFSDNETVIFTGSFSLSGTANISFKRTGMTIQGPSASEYAYLDVANTSGSSAAMSTNSIGSPTLRYVDLTGEASYALLASTNSATASFTVDHCRIHNNRGTGGGIRCVNNGTALTITDSKVSGNPAFGILVSGAGAVTMRRLTLDGNGATGSGNYDQIRIEDGTPYVTSLLLEDVSCTNGLGTESSDYDIGRCTTVIARRCTSTGAAGKGFSAVAASAVSLTMDACIVDGARIGCFWYSSASPSGAVTVGMRNCTITDCTEVGVKAGSSADANENVAVTLRNCIINDCLYAYQEDSDASVSIDADYCCVYGYTTRGLAAGAHDVEQDPMLGTGYSLGNSAVEEAGIWIAGVNLYDGLPQPLRPPIGAVARRNYPGRRFSVGGRI